MGAKPTKERVGLRWNTWVALRSTGIGVGCARCLRADANGNDRSGPFPNRSGECDGRADRRSGAQEAREDDAVHSGEGDEVAGADGA